MSYNTSIFSDLLYDNRRRGIIKKNEDQMVGEFLSQDGRTHRDYSHAENLRSELHGFQKELFGRLYENAQHDETPSQIPWADKAHQALSDSPKFRELQNLLCGDADLSALATTGFNSILKQARMAAEEEKEEEQDSQNGNANGDSGSGRGRGRGLRKIGTARDRLKREADRLAVAAKKEANDMKQQLNGLMAGAGDTPSQKDSMSEDRFEIANRLSDNQQMREVAKIVGRLRRVHSRQKRNSTSGKTQLHSVTRGKEISRILPSELARLAHGSTRDLAMLDLMEGKMLQYELAGQDEMGRGHMVVLLDISGSMSGNPHNFARAIGIFFASIATDEKRAVTVLDFNFNVCWTNRRQITKDGKASVGVQPCTPLKVAADIACAGVSGGTSFDNALKYVMSACDMTSKPDIVFVTDGYDSVTESVKSQIMDFKSNEDLKIWGMLINGGRLHESVDFCDTVIEIQANPNLEDIVSLNGEVSGNHRKP